MSNVRQDPSLEEGSKENMEKNANEKPGKTLIEIEKEQEAKLRSKYPALKGGPGPSTFLQKRLSKGQKYFDSGDYNMAKAKMGGMGGAKPMAPGQKLLLAGSTGDTIPTPESVPHRKASMPIATKMHPHPGLS